MISLKSSRKAWLRMILAVVGLGVSLPLLGCGNNKADGEGAGVAAPSVATKARSGSGPIQVVCTTGMVADIVKNVGGKHVAVIQLMGAGVDPHLYKTTPSDITKLNAADVVFYSGLHLEGKMAELLANLSLKKSSVAIAESLDRHELITVEGGQHDPHVWFDVKLWGKTAAAVGNVLAHFDPTNADEYKQAAAKYSEALNALDGEVRAEIATIPKERRVLVTAHDAFHYFSKAYDIEVKAIQGVSTAAEASVRDVNELVSFIVEHKIKAVFVETSVSDKNIQALVEGCKAKGHSIAIGGELFSDAMGEDGTPEGTYVGMVRANTKTIVSALR